MENKNQSFEIDLMPVISLLAVCISFLLLTTAWVHIGSLEVSQGVGTSSDNKKEPRISITFNGGSIKVSVEDSGKISPKSYKVSGIGKASAWKKVDRYTEAVLKKEPQMKMALIMPSSQTKYQDIIRLIDMFKSKGIVDVGLAPL